MRKRKSPLCFDALIRFENTLAIAIGVVREPVFLLLVGSAGIYLLPGACARAQRREEACTRLCGDSVRHSGADHRESSGRKIVGGVRDGLHETMRLHQ